VEDVESLERRGPFVARVTHVAGRISRIKKRVNTGFRANLFRAARRVKEATKNAKRRKKERKRRLAA
jgi:hypothetical protein